MDHTTTAVAYSIKAARQLRARATQQEAEPELVDAAHVLEALLAAAARSGGGDELILHWLTNSADLVRPRQALGDLRHVRPTRGRGRAGRGRRFGDDLANYDRAPEEYRRAVREIITDAVQRTGATP